MAQANYMPYKPGELIDKTMWADTNLRHISIGNCSMSFNFQSKTFSFITSSDEEWSIQSIENFRRIMNYIETTYGR